MNNEISSKGFSMISDIYNNEEIAKILDVINQVDTSKETFENLLIYLTLDNF